MLLKALAVSRTGAQGSHGKLSDSERRTLSDRVVRSKDGAHRGEAASNNSHSAERTSVFSRRPIVARVFSGSCVNISIKN